MEVFSGGSRSVTSPAKKPFPRGPSPNYNKPYGEGQFYYGKKTNNRGRHNAQYGGKQNKKWNSSVSGKKKKYISQNSNSVTTG